ncbi:MAG: hypothetical protein LUC43_03455 [Burkholderiales bacterium]|nr:hypothetical protein [Burkholderiales bacterium]
MTDETNKFDADWSEATLNDVADAIENLMHDIKEHPEEVKELFIEQMPKIYAKLNYAYHSAEDGSDALTSIDDDELIAFPPILPVSTLPVLSDEDSSPSHPT